VVFADAAVELQVSRRGIAGAPVRRYRHQLHPLLRPHLDRSRKCRERRPTSISLSDSIGPAATVGVLYRLPQNWSVDASFSMAKVKSKLEANTSGAIRRTTIDFKPTAW